MCAASLSHVLQRTSQPARDLVLPGCPSGLPGQGNFSGGRREGKKAPLEACLKWGLGLRPEDQCRRWGRWTVDAWGHPHPHLLCTPLLFKIIFSSFRHRWSQLVAGWMRVSKLNFSPGEEYSYGGVQPVTVIGVSAPCGVLTSWVTKLLRTPFLHMVSKHGVFI